VAVQVKGSALAFQWATYSSVFVDLEGGGFRPEPAEWSVSGNR
jgi:hypothetical protein